MNIYSMKCARLNPNWKGLWCVSIDGEITAYFETRRNANEFIRMLERVSMDALLKIWGK